MNIRLSSMRKFCSGCVFACLLLGLISCAPSPSAQFSNERSSENQPADGYPIVTIVGSTAAMPMLQELSAEFQRREPDAVFEIRGGGSLYGETEVHAGDADLALSTLIIAPDVTDVISDSVISDAGATLIESDLSRVPIALSGLALIVHANNPVAELTLEQLQTIYAGRVSLWREVAGEQDAGEILLVSREELSGARSLFDERVMGGERLSLTSIIVPTHHAVIKSVAANETAIGYVDRGYIAHLLPDASTGVSALEDPPIKVLMVDGLLPEGSVISTQQYPLIYPLYLVRSANESMNQRPFERDPTEVLTDGFVQLIMSQAGQEIVGRYHILIP